MSEHRHDSVLPPDRQLLKTATRALVRAFGNTEAAGVAVGRRQQAISDMQSSTVDAFMPIGDVATLEDNTTGLPGHPHVTRALAQRQGFDLVKRPTALPSDGDLLILMAQLSGQYGEITRSACEALADGVVLPVEASTVAALVQRHVEISVQMIAVLAAIAEGDA